MFRGLGLDWTIRAPTLKKSSILIEAASAIFFIAIIINATFINQNIFNYLIITPAIKTVY